MISRISQAPLFFVIDFWKTGCGAWFGRLRVWREAANDRNNKHRFDPNGKLVA
jgi:hypothetical protein